MMGTLYCDEEGSLRNGWKVLLFLLAMGVANFVVWQLIGNIDWLTDHTAWVPTPLLFFLGCLAMTTLFLRVEGQSLSSIGLHPNGRWLGEFTVGILGGGAIIGATALTAGLAGGFHLVRTPGASLPQLLFGAWTFLAVALNEELGFRGFLFQRMAKGLGPWPAQLILALCFAMAHWGNPGMSGATKTWATLNIALASVLLGLCYLKTRSLALPMGLHLGWNWTQGNLLGFGVSGTSATGWWTPVFHGKAAWVTGQAFGLEASFPCTLVCIVACGLVLSRKSVPAPETECEKFYL